MGDFDLNLSTQPFPAYRLTNIALVCVLIVLGGVSLWQAQGFVRYENLSRSIRAEEQEGRVESESLASTVKELESRLDRPESTAKLNEIGFLNHLILRKELSWTKLFGVLEGMIPENVHLLNLTPDIGNDGTVTLRIGLRARSIADVEEFLKRMETSPLFTGLDVKVEEKSEPTVSTDVEFTLSTVYRPPEAKK